MAKAYSWAANLVGLAGPVPQGMSATVALRVRWLHERHAAVKLRTLELASELSDRWGYTAPYWELVRLARRAKSEIDGGEGKNREIPAASTADGASGREVLQTRTPTAVTVEKSRQLDLRRR